MHKTFRKSHCERRQQSLSGTKEERIYIDMKNRFLSILLGLSFVFVNAFSFHPNIVLAESQQEEVPSELYDEIIDFCPGAKVSLKDNELLIEIADVELPQEPDACAKEIISLCARVFGCEYDVSNFKSIGIVYWPKGSLCTITFLDIKSPCNFQATYSANCGDELNSALNKYYDEILGHFDYEQYMKVLEYALKAASGIEVDKPEAKSIIPFWISSVFAPEKVSYDVENGIMTICVDQSYGNDKSSGLRFYKAVLRAATMYAHMYSACNGNPEFQSVSLNCKDPEGTELCNITFCISNNKITTTELNFFADEFELGYMRK